MLDKIKAVIPVYKQLKSMRLNQAVKATDVQTRELLLAEAEALNQLEFQSQCELVRLLHEEENGNSYLSK